MSTDTSSMIGRASMNTALHANADDLRVTTHDEPGYQGGYCALTFRAGSCYHVTFLERNAHALSTAARALREAADELDGIAAECMELQEVAENAATVA